MFEDEKKVPFSFIYNGTKYFLHRRNLKNMFTNGDSELLLYSDKNNNGYIIDRDKLYDLINNELAEPNYTQNDII